MAGDGELTGSRADRLVGPAGVSGRRGARRCARRTTAPARPRRRRGGRARDDRPRPLAGARPRGREWWTPGRAGMSAITPVTPGTLTLDIDLEISTEHADGSTSVVRVRGRGREVVVDLAPDGGGTPPRAGVGVDWSGVRALADLLAGGLKDVLDHACSLHLRSRTASEGTCHDRPARAKPARGSGSVGSKAASSERDMPSRGHRERRTPPRLRRRRVLPQRRVQGGRRSHLGPHPVPGDLSHPTDERDRLGAWLEPGSRLPAETDGYPRHGGVPSARFRESRRGAVGLARER